MRIIKNEDINCNETGCWYNVISNKEEIGLIYNGRINSFRSGGCSVYLSLEAISGATVSAKAITSDIQNVLSCAF